MSSSSFAFPAFRSEEWIRKEFDAIKAPAAVLEGAELSPDFMSAFPSVGLYPEKVAQVRDQIKTALFRQALFKVQNVEVTYLDECKDQRIIQRVAENTSPSYIGAASDIRNPKDVELLREELWSVNRCGQDADYYVRYYNEGNNGYSASVLPSGFQDMWRTLKYYYFSSS